MKKYQKGGPTKKPSMNPAKIAVGPSKPATPKQKEEALKKFKEAMKKEIEKAPFPAAPPKKQMGGSQSERQLERERKRRDRRIDFDDNGGVKGAIKIAKINRLENRLGNILDKTAAEKKSTSPNQNKINRLDNRFNRVADRQEALLTPDKSIFKKKGGSLKPINPNTNPGLSKLPTAVRNNMGYKKSGGTIKKKK